MRPGLRPTPAPRQEQGGAPSVPGCGGTAPVDSMTVAMAYVPIQSFGGMYTPEKALRQGTAFPCLDKPFEGMTVCGMGPCMGDGPCGGKGGC